MSITQATLDKSLQVVEGIFVGKNDLQNFIEALALKLDIPHIDNDDELAEAARRVKDAKGVIKQVEEARKAYTRQLDGLKKHLMGQEAELVAPLKRVVDAYATLSAAYAEKKRQAQLEAQRAAAKAAAEAQLAQERAAAQAKAAEALGIAESSAAKEAQAEADKAAEHAANALSEQQLAALKPVAGVTLRSRWDFRVTDPDKVDRRFLVLDASLVRAELQRLKKSGASLSSVHLDGIEVFETTSAVAR